jgi:hypothetical protein
MKPLTKKQHQWGWFLLLWVGGIAATLLLSYGMRWIIRL